MIHEQIKEDVRGAMKKRDRARLRASRNLLTALINEAVIQGKKPGGLLDDKEALDVIKRLARERRDAIEQFREGGREDLVKVEEEELSYLEEYLPKMMGKVEIKKIAEAKKKELGIEDKSKMGMLMGTLMAELEGRAEGKDVKAVVDELFE